MELKIRITTPKGQAKGTERKLRPFLLGKNSPHTVTTNVEDNEIIWIVESNNPRAFLAIQRNVFYFDKMVQGVLNSKMVKKAIRDKFSKEQEQELNDMLTNHTKVELIKG